MLWFIVGSLISLLLSLICLRIRGFVAASLLWTNEQHEVCIEIGAQRIGLKRSRNYSAADFDLLPGLENYPRSLSLLYSILSRMKKAKKISSLILKLLIIQKLEWKSALGCDDAMGTALANGTLWGIKGSFASFLSSKSRVEKIDFFIRPEFSKKCFESRVHCIFRMRVAHIIFVAIYYLTLNTVGLCRQSIISIRNRWG